MPPLKRSEHLQGSALPGTMAASGPADDCNRESRLYDHDRSQVPRQTGGRRNGDGEPVSSPPPVRRLAADLLGDESAGSGENGADVTHRVLDRFHEVFAPLIGKAGYETVLARGVLRGAERSPSLYELEVPRAGAPTHENISAVLERSEDADGAGVTLVEEMLTFLGRLIGWGLTLQVLSRAWPDVVASRDPAVLEKSTKRIEGKL